MTAPARRGGRPSLQDAAQLADRILDAATELLLTHGYGATSIEAIARRARVSKRTFYHRFRDKPALMAAVVKRLIDRQRPAAGVPLIEGAGLEAILSRLASMILAAALHPQVLALHRLIVAESGRFPDLAAAITQSGGRQEAVDLIAGLLSGHAGSVRPAPASALAAAPASPAAQFRAQQFLQMVVSLPQLRALGLGQPMTAAELDAWVRDTVALFLRGATA